MSPGRAEPQTTLIGTSVADGKYELLSVIGTGGMGTVYRGRHTAAGRTVAVKVLDPAIMNRPRLRARFEREARCAGRLSHPNSVQVLDWGITDDGLSYIVMEYLYGRPLSEIIHEEAPLAPERALHILAQVFAALTAAHECDVVHRDIKPENIMVDRRWDQDGVATEFVKVCDFGLAKIGSSADSDAELAITQAGEVFGTPAYMSPEQARGRTMDPRSDIYSCGVVLFHMLTGALPFYSETAIGALLQHVNDPPPDPRSVNPNLAPELAELILAALEKRPEARPETALEFQSRAREALANAQARQSTELIDLSRATEELSARDAPAAELETFDTEPRLPAWEDIVITQPTSASGPAAPALPLATPDEPDEVAVPTALGRLRWAVLLGSAVGTAAALILLT